MLTTVEWCSHCGEESEIPAVGISKCPSCGHEIWPCSMCEVCNSATCPYEKKN